MTGIFSGGYASLSVTENVVQETGTTPTVSTLSFFNSLKVKNDLACNCFYKLTGTSSAFVVFCLDLATG
jgi:hypothetical protein